MKRGFLETYAMIACTILGLYGLILISAGIWDVLLIANPAWEMTTEHDGQYLSNDAFCRESFRECDPMPPSMAYSAVISCSGKEDCDQQKQAQKAADQKLEEERQAQILPEAITRKRLEALENEKNMRHQRTMMGLIHNIVQGLIIAVLFFIHWRIGSKARSQNNQGAGNA